MQCRNTGESYVLEFVTTYMQ